MPINILFNTVVMPISSSPALANMSRPDGGLAGWLTVILILPCRHVRPASASASGRPRGGGANRSRQAGGQADSYLHRARRRQFLLRVYGALVHRVVRLFGGLVNSTVTVAELTTAWLEHSFADHSTSSALSAACRASTGWTGGVGRLLTFWGDRQVGAPAQSQSLELRWGLKACFGRDFLTPQPVIPLIGEAKNQGLRL